MIKHHARRPARVRPDRRDAGTTLVEVMVTLGIMSVAMAVATAGILQMYRSSYWSEASSIDMSQLQTAFERLDRTVRYASAISEPNPAATAGGGWYVEWSITTAGVTTCTQLRLDGPSGRLQSRSMPSGGQIGGWSTIASSLGGTQPFALEPASASGYPHQRLTVTLTVGSTGHTRPSLFTFTALNSSLATDSSDVCTGMDRP